MANKENTALQTQNKGFLALGEADFGRIMAEELDGLDIGFERIKTPSGGGIAFEMVGEDGEPETVREFLAVILHHHTLNCYYKTDYTGGNNPPDCGSFDGVTGIGDPGGDCKTCRFNKFGTGVNGSKACKNRRRIFLIREGEVFPLLFSLPTGSLREFTKYLKLLVSKGKNSNAFVTRFSLKKAANSKGAPYSQVQFARDRELLPEEYAVIEKMTEQVKAYSAQLAFDYDNIDDGSAEDIAVDPDTGELIQPLGGGDANV